MLTGRQLNCFRGSGCLSQIEIRFGEKAKCDIANSKRRALGALGFRLSHSLLQWISWTALLCVDKPEGLTSHDVVNRMRRLANTRKVGHLGTLDPMATGVLPLVLGRATRLAQFFSAGEKTYDARVQFGWATDTYDREGSPISEPVEPHFTRAELEAVLDHFRGTILQTPPPFSAKKIAGTPAYRLARKHIAVELEPVEVRVLALDLGEFDGTTARISVRCSAGHVSSRHRARCRPRARLRRLPDCLAPYRVGRVH